MSKSFVDANQSSRFARRSVEESIIKLTRDSKLVDDHQSSYEDDIRSLSQVEQQRKPLT